VNPASAARLQDLRIEWFASEKGYTMFTRENCAAIGHTQADGYSVGSTGMMTAAGFSFLMWRDGQAFFVAHGGAETPASPEQVEAARQFSEDLKVALAR
jgi:hypothetical protein